MDKVRIQDDLYNAVNGEWLEQAVIPDDKPTTGGFSDLDKDVEALMLNEFNEMVKSNKYPNSYLENAIRLYKIAANTKKRNKDGIKPCLKTLDKIYKLNDVKGLNRKLKEFILEDLPLPLRFGVDVDMKDALHYCVAVAGPDTILPDTTFYKEEKKDQHDQIIAIWKNMAEQVLAFSPLTKEEQVLFIEDTLKFDELVAGIVKSSEEWADYVKAYNPTKVSSVASKLKPLKIKKLCNDLFGFIPEMIIVNEPRFLKEFKTLFNEETFPLYKHWAYVRELLGSTAYLSEDLRALGSIYRQALTGVAKIKTPDKYAYSLASSFFSEPVGLYYGEKYFGEEAKKDVVDMVKQIIETYKYRVRRSEILSPSTKDKAVLKLSTMKIKMGYPDKVDPFYDQLIVNEKDNLYKVVTSLSKLRLMHEIEKLPKEVDKAKWPMPGHMVNACYSPTNNDITFPAAILQPPFYSIKQTRSANLGGIGAVIGHEISHAFDNNGAKFDENGNINEWWTKEDFKKFEARTKAMIKQFDGIELPWGKVNSKLIVSENIADNGGVATTLEIMGKMKEKSYEEYFMNWARVWCMKGREQYLQLLLSVDVHGPAILRANMPPRNFDEWYTTFDVKKTDKMYIAPNKRVVIW